MKAKEKKLKLGSPISSKTKVVKAKAIKEAYLMALWSEAVKVRDGYKCIYCGKTNDEVRLNSHHVFSRRHNSVRYDLDNGVTLCCGHHHLLPFSAHQSPEFILWMVQFIGEEKYKELKVKAGQVKKYTPTEKIKIAEDLKKYIKENKNV